MDVSDINGDTGLPFTTSTTNTHMSRMMTPFAPIPTTAFSTPPSFGSLPQSHSTSLQLSTTLPSIKDDSSFREVIPDFRFPDSIETTDNEFVINEASFTCDIRGAGAKNLREKACTLCVAYRPAGYDTMHSVKVKFKVYAGSTMKRGKRSLRRDVWVFKLQSRMLLRIICRSPVFANGTLKWTEEKREKFMAFEDGLMYSLQVLAVSSDAQAKLMGKYPLGLLVADSSIERAKEVHGNEPKRQRRTEMYSCNSNSKKMKKHELIHSVLDLSLLMAPDLSSTASEVCKSFRIASYTFKCQMVVGTAPNLRQRASHFDIFIKSCNADGDPVGDVLQHLKYKIYADSTIRRGKKSLRRDDFVFRIGDTHVVNVFCKTPLVSRGSLKWTEEKQEEFLAFECGLEYIIQIFSDQRGDDARVYRMSAESNDERIVGWTDELHPERINEPIRRIHDSDSMDNETWNMEPTIWNLSLNTDANFMVMISAPDGEMPDHPTIVFHAKDQKIEVQPYQYDLRKKRSIFVIVPRLFSEDKVKQATMKGVQFARQVATYILDERGQTVWTTTLTYEVGITSSPFTVPNNNPVSCAPQSLIV